MQPNQPFQPPLPPSGGPQSAGPTPQPQPQQVSPPQPAMNQMQPGVPQQMPNSPQQPIQQPMAPLTPQPQLMNQQFGTQPGMSPAPGPQPFNTGQASQKASFLSVIISKLKFIIPAIVLIIVLGIGAFFAKDILFDPTKIKASSLVDSSYSGVAMKMPKGWDKVSGDKIKMDEYDLYSKGGADSPKEAVLLVGYVTESLGVDISIFSDTQKQALISEFKESFKDSLNEDNAKDGWCARVNDNGLNIKEVDYPNFDMAIQVDAGCSGDEGEVKVRLLVGFKKDNVYGLIVAGLDNIFDKNEPVIDEIYNSFKPAN